MTARAEAANTYAPSQIEFKVLPNKVYLLTWQQHGHSRQKLLTRNTAFKYANDVRETPKPLREAITNAFIRGDIQ